MNCDRFIGTGLVEVVKPIQRRRRSSSVHGRYVNCKTAQTNCPSNQKFFSMRVKARFDTSFYPKDTKNAETYVPDINMVNDNKDILKLEETEVIVPTSLICQRNNRTKSQSVIQDDGSRRHSLNVFRQDVEVKDYDNIGPLRTKLTVISTYQKY